MNMPSRRAALGVAVCLCLAACERNAGPLAPPFAGPAASAAPSAPAAAHRAPSPILFVTQVPLHSDFAARLSTFANHLPGDQQSPRGGALMLRYPDGALRNLSAEAGFRDVAVREPTVHWDAQKAVFSMLDGATWQLYEASGLAPGARAVVRKIPGQPERYNNVSPLYDSADRVLFTSDRPRNGERKLYPQLDEYEATPTTTGIWRLDPASRQLVLLNHTPSGAFSPTLDSFGRIVFTRWDHLQQDQLADRDRDAVHNGVALPFQSFNYASERADARPTASREEAFPESRAGGTGPYGEVSAYISNFFAPWAMNQDGSNEETLNHVGLHELSFGYQTPSFRDDPALTARTSDRLHANRFALRREGGLFQLREDPVHPGEYLGVAARESASFTTNTLVRLRGGPGANPEQMVLTALTEAAANDVLKGGRYRNPLPLSDGSLLASRTASVRAPEQGGTLDGLRLTWLERGADGVYRAGAPLTAGIRAAVARSGSHGQPGAAVGADGGGLLWELEAVEVRARPRPPLTASVLEAPERAVLAEEQVSEQALRDWLIRNELALIVTRDQTSRDRAEKQQPYNLRVPGGKQTTAPDAAQARVYDISHFQIFQADQLRAYPDRAGRRVLARPMHEATAGGRAANPAPAALGSRSAAAAAPASAPPGSVRIAADGSTAAFVPARRALTWQTTDAQGNAVVRERNWVTFQPGEMRTCAACHGVNTATQAGLGNPINKPEALRSLLAYWKANWQPNAKPGIRPD